MQWMHLILSHSLTSVTFSVGKINHRVICDFWLRCNLKNKKIKKKVGILLYKARFYVTRKSPPYLAVLFLISLSISYILQRNMEFWISYEQQNRIYLLQKRTVRTICAADYRASSKPLFQKLTILTFIVCFHSKLDPSCICTAMKCYLPHFKTYL